MRPQQGPSVATGDIESVVVVATMMMRKTKATMAAAWSECSRISSLSSTLLTTEAAKRSLGKGDGICEESGVELRQDEAAVGQQEARIVPSSTP
uniref:Uncharacterized protein n=1 Tax=Arundo donax TaxID=35708 RepID=A0A0A8YQC6_ARUDO